MDNLNNLNINDKLNEIHDYNQSLNSGYVYSKLEKLNAKNKLDNKTDDKTDDKLDYKTDDKLNDKSDNKTITYIKYVSLIFVTIILGPVIMKFKFVKRFLMRSIEYIKQNKYKGIILFLIL